MVFDRGTLEKRFFFSDLVSLTDLPCSLYWKGRGGIGMVQVVSRASHEPEPVGGCVCVTGEVHCITG